MKTNVHFLMLSIIENDLSVHKVSSDLYKRLKIYFKDCFKEHKNKKILIFFSLIGDFKLPYFKMGIINSSTNFVANFIFIIFDVVNNIGNSYSASREDIERNLDYIFK